MDRETGLSISTIDHIRQSIGDILTTPLGSRVMRRDYGSLLPDLIDQPMNRGGQLKLFAATAAALIRWEPRIQLTRVQLSIGDDAGSWLLAISAVLTDSNAAVQLSVPLKLGAA